MHAARDSTNIPEGKREIVSFDARLEDFLRAVRIPVFQVRILPWPLSNAGPFCRKVLNTRVFVDGSEVAVDVAVVLMRWNVTLSKLFRPVKRVFNLGVADFLEVTQPFSLRY